MSLSLSVDEALRHARQVLKHSDCAALDAELLLCHVLKVEPVYLRTWPQKALSETDQQAFLGCVEQRKEGRPVAHIIGHRGFWTLDLDVDNSTLIPRPDTECLVESILESFDDSPRSLLDLGTGTGAIALAIASERPGWEILASDLSQDAINLAKRNASKHAIENAQFLCGSWFEPLPDDCCFDLIVSNPPYIEADDPHLAEGDLRYEPRSALVSEGHGLSDIKQIAQGAKARLAPDGWLYLEHGYQQAGDVQAILQGMAYINVQTIKDYGGNDRITRGQLA